MAPGLPKQFSGYCSSLFFLIIFIVYFSASVAKLTFHDAFFQPAPTPRHWRWDGHLVFTFTGSAALWTGFHF
jgi:hypothetical protein